MENKCQNCGDLRLRNRKRFFGHLAIANFLAGIVFAPLLILAVVFFVYWYRTDASSVMCKKCKHVFNID